MVDAPATARQLQGVIRTARETGSLRFVVLIGDAPAIGQEPSSTTVPTNYVPAKVNIRWGSTPDIASDIPYAERDGGPTIAIGRLPVHSTSELASVIRKELRYEQHTEHGAWEKSLSIAAGMGGFGTITDAMIEAAGKQVIQKTVPADFEVRQIHAATTDADGKPVLDFGDRVRRQLCNGGLAWIYVGHGLPTELDRAPTPNGWKSILSTRDIPQLRCGPHYPLAVLVACYTGAIDASRDCVAEDLLLSEDGPVAVIAATRVTMPYGNTVMGYELLRACFQDQPAELGDVLRLAQARVLTPTPNDQMRSALDGLADALSPAPVDLAAERREHVLMYQLVGDPLLRLHRAPIHLAQAANSESSTK